MASGVGMAAPSLWLGLPFDLLYDISCRLHDAADYVRFHAVCKAWRDAHLPAPAFQPWLLTPSDHRYRRRARCVFDSKSICRRSQRRIIHIEDRTTWVFSGHDGTACGGSSPVPRSAPTPALFPCNSGEIRSWVDAAVGRVSRDGTILRYAWVVRHRDASYPPGPINFNMDLQRPSDAAWKFLQRYGDTRAHRVNASRDQCCIAYHKGRIVLCKRTSWIIWPAPGELGHPWRGKMPHDPDNVFQSGYLLESRGELLWVSVWLSQGYFTNRNMMKTPPSVSVYSLQEHRGHGELESRLQWVKIESRSLADRVMFLGHPTSFAVDPSQYGMIGGCAYFIIHRSRLCPEVIKYRLDNDSIELVERLPEDFRGEACSWLTPQPVIAPSKEIRQRVLDRIKLVKKKQQEQGRRWHCF